MGEVGNPRARVRGTYLPSGDDAEIHQCLDSLVPCSFECFTLITDHAAESLDVLSSNGDLWAVESLSDTDSREDLIVTEPEAPIKVLDARAANLRDFVDWNRTE